MIVKPEPWYMAFWVAMLVGLYFVVKFAIVAADRAIKSGEIIVLPELIVLIVTAIVVAIIMRWG